MHIFTYFYFDVHSTWYWSHSGCLGYASDILRYVLYCCISSKRRKIQWELTVSIIEEIHLCRTCCIIPASVWHKYSKQVSFLDLKVWTDNIRIWVNCASKVTSCFYIVGSSYWCGLNQFILSVCFSHQSKIKLKLSHIVASLWVEQCSVGHTDSASIGRYSIRH